MVYDVTNEVRERREGRREGGREGMVAEGLEGQKHASGFILPPFHVLIPPVFPPPLLSVPPSP